MIQMNDIKWSKEQELAINSTSSNVLISAGAGSGKTAVLTERIYQLVKKGADLSRFLVLTFTNAASGEMKERVRKRILKDKDLADAAVKIDSAHIETFDSFALFIVKKYAFRLGVSPNIGVLDNTLFTIKRREILDKLITHLYEIEDKDFLDLISRYCNKSDQQIRTYIIDLCDYFSAKTNKEECIEQFVDKYFNKEKIEHIIEQKYQDMNASIDDAISKAEHLEDPVDADKIVTYLENLKEISPDFDSFVTNIAINKKLIPDKSGSVKTSDEDFRNSIKEGLSKNLIDAKTYGTSKEIIEQFMSTKKDVETLLKIVKEVEKEAHGFKIEKSLYLFSDIATLALKALEMEDIRKELSDYFQYILVDEYQDTSALQELVINKLEQNNVCMVGDIKQSIYRFRGADCSLFQEKYLKYKENDGGQLINLNTSYRSRREVVDVVNEMFEQLMTSRNNPINYKDGHIFGFGFKEYNSLIDKKEDYKLKIYKYQKEKGKQALYNEIEIIAKDIIHKINNKYQVYDKDLKRLRDCSFKDFAILMSKGKQFEKIKAGLSEYGIPTKVFYKESVVNSEVYTVLKNLLVIFERTSSSNYDNSFNHAFVSVARSFICRYKDQDIYDYITKKAFLESPLMVKMVELTSQYKYSSLYSIINALIDSFNVYDNLSRIKHFSSNANKIELIVSIAKQMDDIGMSINELISYFENINAFNLEIEYEDKDVGNDSITIMTIHKSKGLEFPIVYMPSLTSIGKAAGGTAFLIDEEYGAVLPGVGEDAKTSLFNHLIKLKETKGAYEERLRLLYVAITRARERLIMLYGESENGEKHIYDVLQANTFQKLINYIEFNYKYGIDFVLENSKLAIKQKTIQPKHIETQTIDVQPSIIEKKRASKEQYREVDSSLLAFGNQIHYLLEITNFETKDTSFITNPKQRRYVDNVLKQKVFDNVKNNQILHEFSFFDEKNGVHGIIDCLVIRDNQIDIVDFKLKNLDDDKYVLQLHAYRDYIKQISPLKINMCLISAITGEVKEIE